MFTQKNPLQKFLLQYAKSNNPLFFIQIGANDGITSDPIHELVKKYRWKGILVEPVPYLFRKLKENYANQSADLIFANIAISQAVEKRKIYYISDEKGELPTWATGLNSFNKDHILWQERNFPMIGEFIEEETINCMPLSDLMKQNSVERLDLLLIDVEGYDYEVLKQLDSTPCLPNVVIYEHQCLGEKKNLSQDFIKSKGYEIFESGGDTIACLNA